MKVLHRYEFRTAFAADIFLKVNRDLTKAIEANFAKQCKVEMNNHITYRFEDVDRKVYYVTFSDTYAQFGTKVNVTHF